MYEISTTKIVCPKCREYFLYRQRILKSNIYTCTGCGFMHAAESDKEMRKYANNITQEEAIKKKETDYHAKQDYGKAKLSLVPRRIIWDVAAIREYGNNKYPDGGPDNWRSVEPERYRDAAYRHFLRYLDDPKSIDRESGFPHLWHLACNIAFLCEMEDAYLSKGKEVMEGFGYFVESPKGEEPNE